MQWHSEQGAGAEGIIKAMFGKGEGQHYHGSQRYVLIIQTRKEILVQEMDKKANLKRIPTDSSLPMVPNLLTPVTIETPLQLFYH
jgi:hypothetical protein